MTVKVGPQAGRPGRVGISPRRAAMPADTVPPGRLRVSGTQNCSKFKLNSKLPTHWGKLNNRHWGCRPAHPDRRSARPTRRPARVRWDSVPRRVLRPPSRPVAGRAFAPMQCSQSVHPRSSPTRMPPAHSARTGPMPEPWARGSPAIYPSPSRHLSPGPAPLAVQQHVSCRWRRGSFAGPPAVPGP